MRTTPAPPESDSPPVPDVITFTQRAHSGNNDKRVLEEIPVRDHEAVRHAADRYRRAGYLLVDAHGRSMHPAECVAVALERPDRSIMVVPRNDSSPILDPLVTPPSRKRKGGELGFHRPRKVLVVD